MAENISVHEIARAWVDTLTARGVIICPRGKTVVLVPKSAYGAMSTEERETLKQHKAKILELVREWLTVHAGSLVEEAPQLPTVTPAPEPCAYCHQAPCIGPEHEHFLTLHPHEARQHNADLDTREMRARVGQPARWEY